MSNKMAARYIVCNSVFCDKVSVISIKCQTFIGGIKYEIQFSSNNIYSITNKWNHIYIIIRIKQVINFAISRTVFLETTFSLQDSDSVQILGDKNN